MINNQKSMRAPQHQSFRPTLPGNQQPASACCCLPTDARAGEAWCGDVHHMAEESVLCEAKYGGLFRMAIYSAGAYFPEVGSVISAVFIIWCGVHMMIFWTHESVFLRLLSAMFIGMMHHPAH